MAEPKRWRRWLKRLALFLLALLIIAQAWPYGRDHTNPPVSGEPEWDTPRTRELFMRTCGDCHSHETRWPWYSHVAPASWLVQKDVDEAREHFNVSIFDVDPGDADDAAHEFEEGEMPLWFYTPLHSEARLSDEDREALLAGLRATFGED
jgi:mono/diheme cytochrome c family protein